MVSLKKKYKIIKKVKEHHKKNAKEAKKLGLHRNPKTEKDPGIPPDWLFKEQELKALEARLARALEAIELKKAARKEWAQKRKLGLLEDDEMYGNGSSKRQNFGEGSSDVSTLLGKNLGNSDSASYKELVKVIEDVV